MANFEEFRQVISSSINLLFISKMHSFFFYFSTYRESSRYAHFGTGKNSHKWKIAYLESNVVMPCKVNLTIRMSNAQSSTYTV